MTSVDQTIVRALTGDAEAIRQLVIEFQDTIFSECAKIGLWGHPDWSQSDLSQEVIFRVMKNLDKFKGTNSVDSRLAFDQWVRVTARNALLNLSRDINAKKRHPGTGIKQFDEAAQAFFANQNHGRTASSIFIQDEEIVRLNRAMAECLDDEGRQILTLRVAEGLSLKEIAQRLGLTYDQVRYKFDKSLGMLQRQLGDA